MNESYLWGFGGGVAKAAHLHKLAPITADAFPYCAWHGVAHKQTYMPLRQGAQYRGEDEEGRARWRCLEQIETEAPHRVGAVVGITSIVPGLAENAGFWLGEHVAVSLQGEGATNAQAALIGLEWETLRDESTGYFIRPALHLARLLGALGKQPGRDWAVLALAGNGSVLAARLTPDAPDLYRMAMAEGYYWRSGATNPQNWRRALEPGQVEQWGRGGNTDHVPLVA